MNKLDREINRNKFFNEADMEIYNLLMRPDHYVREVEVYIDNKYFKTYSNGNDIMKNLRSKLRYPRFDYKYKSGKFGEILTLYFREYEYAKYFEGKR